MYCVAIEFQCKCTSVFSRMPFSDCYLLTIYSVIDSEQRSCVRQRPLLFDNSIERRRKRGENTATIKWKQLVNFDYQNVNSLCSRHHKPARASSGQVLVRFLLGSRKPNCLFGHHAQAFSLNTIVSIVSNYKCM